MVRGRGRAGGGFHHHGRQRRGSYNVHLPAFDASAQERVHRDGGLVLLIVNLLKVPLQVFVWKNISAATLTFDAIMVPAIAVGAVIGIVAAGKIPEGRIASSSWS